MRQTVRLGLLLFILLVAPGCYKYTPVQSPQPGMEVRAQLEVEAAVRRSQGLEEPVMRYDGVIVDITPEKLELDVLVARSASAFQDVTIRDTITLQTAEVRSIMRRTLSPVRSTLFALGSGVAALGIVMSIEAIVGGTGDDDGDGRPPAMRVPAFRWTSSRMLPTILLYGK